MHFSIIVPVYNGEKYLPECLESIARQTCDDYELVIVDDGSFDDSGDIADAFAEEHENVRVLHGQNQGPLLARRKGLSYCQGEYVVFVDADDALHEEALAKVTDAIVETGADIVSFRFSRLANFSNKDDLEFLPEGLYDGKDYRLFERAVCRGLSNNLWGKAIRFRHIDVDVAYETNAGLMLGEDLLQILPIVESAKSFARIQDVLYFYRPNEAGSTANFRHSYIANTECVAASVLEYGERWNMREEAIIGCLSLYVSLSKMLSDTTGRLGREAAEVELSEVCASLKRLSPGVEVEVRHARLDWRVLLDAVLADSLLRVRLVTELSHLGRKLIRRSI